MLPEGYYSTCVSDKAFLPGLAELARRVNYYGTKRAYYFVLVCGVGFFFP